MKILIFLLLIAEGAMAQPLTVLWDRSGAGNESYYGNRVYSLGDQNEDGYNDFAVWGLGSGEPGQTNEAVVELFHGGNPISTIPYMTFRGDSQTESYLAYFLSVGDLNGDSAVDWLVATFLWSDQSYYTLHLFWGGADADTVEDLSFNISSDSHVSSISDFNGDGYSDLFIYFYPPQDYGEVLYGSSSMDTIPDWVRHSPQENRYQASPLSSGDINGDGYSDFISCTPPPERITYIFHGASEPDTIPFQTLEQVWTPHPVVLDFNGDNRGDILNTNGGVEARLGGESIHAIPDFILNFPCSGANSIYPIGDYNHDQHSDFVAVDVFCDNGSGATMLYLGYNWLNSNPVIQIHGRSAPLNLIGINNATGLGDVNGDGIDDFAIGAFNSNTDGRRGRVVIVSGNENYHVGLDDPQVFIPEELKISAYPNPFNPTTTILFSLERESQVKLEVFDVTGRLVRELINEKMQAGEHRVEFNGENLASGIYLYRIETPSFSQTKKMVLLK